MPDEKVVFFDGICNLCNATVDFLIRRDALRRLRFASLQSETARRLLGVHLEQSGSAPSSVLVLDAQGKVWRESDAILSALHSLGGAWRAFARAAHWIPRFFRDAVYRLIARRRYAWFGKRAVCRMPTSEERARFL